MKLPTPSRTRSARKQINMGGPPFHFSSMRERAAKSDNLVAREADDLSLRHRLTGAGPNYLAFGGG
ncbi:hypothetical protein BDZ94DRAFT_1065179 [Collybia nuda]|uniref:Uncharacterized protein n=1 Tax=Collybia nuda TaxID=64659 RepID=A0A9P6CAZ1_9AGAR|nr:hypothetical protein BDZ94DRAFT_1065179 [Collybia nuda]